MLPFDPTWSASARFGRSRHLRADESPAAAARGPFENIGPGQALYAPHMDEKGYETPEEAVLADFGAAARYVTVLGVRVRGNEATVWMLTNDRPAFEAYTCLCVQEDGRWTEVWGSSGFAHPVPPEVDAAAERIRAQFR